MSHNLLDFYSNLFGIDRTIPSSNKNDSGAIFYNKTSHNFDT